MKELKSLSNADSVAVNANEALVHFANSGWTAQKEYYEILKNLKELVGIIFIFACLDWLCWKKKKNYPKIWINCLG